MVEWNFWKRNWNGLKFELPSRISLFSSGRQFEDFVQGVVYADGSNTKVVGVDCFDINWFPHPNAFLFRISFLEIELGRSYSIL